MQPVDKISYKVALPWKIFHCLENDVAWKILRTGKYNCSGRRDRFEDPASDFCVKPKSSEDTLMCFKQGMIFNGHMCR